MASSLPGFSIHGVLQARTLEWAAIPSSPGDLPDPGIEPWSPALHADSLPSEPHTCLVIDICLQFILACSHPQFVWESHKYNCVRFFLRFDMAFNLGNFAVSGNIQTHFWLSLIEERGGGSVGPCAGREGMVVNALKCSDRLPPQRMIRLKSQQC